MTEPPPSPDPRGGRRRRALLAGALACLVGAVALWGLALSAGGEGRATLISTIDPGREGARVFDGEEAEIVRRRARPQRRPPERKVAEQDRPRTRLAEDQEFAYGRAVARIRIPAIRIDAPVIGLGLNSDGSLQVPGEASKAGWWSGGARAGRPGAAVVVGHVDSRGGPGVFYRLGALSSGDRVSVTYNDGSGADFVVTDRRAAPKDRFPTKLVYGDTPEPTLRLVTCTGSFDQSRGHYRSNLIVFARRDGAAPS